MKKHSILVIIAIVLLASAGHAQTDAVASLPRLTNSEILEMVRAGITADVITAKIKVSRCNFNTEPTVLADLRYKGVPNEVLKAMIEAPYGPSKIEGTEPSTNPKTKVDEGLKTQSGENESRLIAARAALKALRKLKSASEVGVSYVNYGPLVVDAKTEVDDAAAKMPDGALRTAILNSLRQYELASEVWNRYWQTDFIDGGYKDLAVNHYGVKKKGLLRVVWRADFLRAIWNEASNQFEIAQRLLSTTGESAGPRHLLTGAWTISIMGNEAIEFTLTVESNGNGMLRTPQGNAIATVSCKERKCLISASDTYEKRILTIRLEGTIEALTLRSNGDRVADSMTGMADIDDGKRKGSFPFKAIKVGR